MAFTPTISNISKLCAAGLLCLVVTTGISKGEPMTSSDLILVPEPKLSRFVFGGYELDEAATLAHYDALFVDKTAEEVVAFLEAQDMHVFYRTDPSRIGILLERLVTFFYYRASIDFIFDDGVFQKAELGGYGVK